MNKRKTPTILKGGRKPCKKWQRRSPQTNRCRRKPPKCGKAGKLRSPVRRPAGSMRRCRYKCKKYQRRSPSGHCKYDEETDEETEEETEEETDEEIEEETETDRILYKETDPDPDEYAEPDLRPSKQSGPPGSPGPPGPPGSPGPPGPSGSSGPPAASPKKKNALQNMVEGVRNSVRKLFTPNKKSTPPPQQSQPPPLATPPPSRATPPQSSRFERNEPVLYTNKEGENEVATVIDASYNSDGNDYVVKKRDKTIVHTTEKKLKKIFKTPEAQKAYVNSRTQQGAPSRTQQGAPSHTQQGVPPSQPGARTDEGRKALFRALKRQNASPEQLDKYYTSKGAPTPAEHVLNFEKDVERIDRNTPTNLLQDFEHSRNKK